MDESKTERGGFVKGKVPLEKALHVAGRVERQLLDFCPRVSITGSVLRRKPVVGDVDVLALPADFKAFLQALKAQGFRGDDRITRKMVDGVLVEVYIAHHEKEMGALKLYTTGDIPFVREFRHRARDIGLELTPYGLYERDTHEPLLESPYERDYFEMLGIPWTAPEDRNTPQEGQHAKMGDRYLPPKEWSPFWKKMTSPRKKEIFPGVSWDFRRWRNPDAESEGRMTWYGPAGREGDEAAVLLFQDGGWGFGQYTGVAGLIDDAPAPILSTWTFLSYKELQEAILEKQGIEVPVDALERAADVWAPWAAAVASTKLAYYGGQEEFVESLP